MAACQYVVVHTVMSDKISSATEKLSGDICCSWRFVSCFSLHKSTVLHVVLFEYGTWSDLLTEAYSSTKGFALSL